MIKVYWPTILIGRTEGKRPFGRPRCRWEDSVIMDLKETGCENVECVYLTQDRDQWRALVSRVMNLRVPQKLRNFFY
jgi:hypothetical protein